MGLENFYGNDKVENRFVDPKTNEQYFVLVNKQTGEKELWNEDFGFADKKVATISPDGEINYNGNWFSNVNQDDKDFAETIVNNGDLDRYATNVAKKYGNLTNAETKNLLKGNTTNLLNMDEDDLKRGLSALSSTTKSNTSDGTRLKFDKDLRFPKDMSPQQDIIQFNMLKYVPRKMNEKTFGWSDREKRDMQHSIGSVVLPIPSGIQDNMAVKWGDDSMNAVTSALAQAALEGITAGDPVDGVVTSLQKSANKVLEHQGEAKAGLAAYFAGKAVNNENMLARTTGAIMNPNMELLFTGPTLRPFTFNFTLSARNKDESIAIKKIIRFFKQGMAPIRSKSMIFLKSPHTFQLRYKYRGGNNMEDHPYLNQFKECALQGFGVQYTPTGNYSTFGDGAMTQYNVSMTFSELEPIFNDDYAKLDNNQDTVIGY